MTFAWNRADGIRQYLKNLTGLNLLAKDRRESCRVREDSLNEFCVLGRFWLDASGNVGKITQGAPATLYQGKEACPPVLTRDEMVLFMRGESWGWSYQWPFPPAYATCSICGVGWTIDNCHDMVTGQESDYIDISDLAGTRLADIPEIPSLAGKVKHFIDRETVGGHGLSGEDIRTTTSGLPFRYVEKDHVVLPGDVAFVQIVTFTHTTCYRRDLAKTQRAEMEKTFADAGYPKVNLITIPNEYWGKNEDGESPHYAAPWYLAQVEDLPPIKIGWRKRVININWSATKMRLSDDVFASENVTRDPTLIHAYGYGKAAEYLAKIIPALAAHEARG